MKVTRPIRWAIAGLILAVCAAYFIPLFISAKNRAGERSAADALTLIHEAEPTFFESEAYGNHVKDDWVGESQHLDEFGLLSSSL